MMPAALPRRAGFHPLAYHALIVSKYRRYRSIEGSKEAALVAIDEPVYIVSGSGSGIGAATARLLAEAGGRVVLGDIDEARVAAVADAIGKAASARRLDVTAEDDWAAIVDFTLGTHGRLDGLVNSAGVLSQTSILEITPAEFMRVVAVNQLGVFLGVRAVVPPLAAARRGAIVNVSSCAGFGGTRRGVAYTTSKFAVRGITKGLVNELGAMGIRINSVEPGYIDTPMSRPDWPEGTDAAGRQPADVPLRRTGRPDEVGRLIRYLLSDEASYCTGGDYVADGGLLALLPAREAAPL
jgi:3alpha(or 20beta)-hydroxysteroid dehydrogenase